MKSYSLSLVFLAAILTAPAVWADAAIEGTVKDPNGNALKGADIRIELKDGSAWHKVAKTDATGHYEYTGLPGGNYRVSLVVNGAVKASINNVKAKAGSTNLNFDLQKNAAPAQAVASAKRKTHKVWFPAQTGSNLGGRWVEVQGGDNTAGSSDVRKVGGTSLNSVQSNSSNHSTGGN